MMPSALCHARGGDLPSMISTLNSYENMFGPYHLQTLVLTARIAQALWAAGETRNAQRLLEYSAKHLDRYGDAHAVRVSTLIALRELLLEQPDFEKAIAVQREIVMVHPDAPDEKARLASMLMSIDPGRDGFGSGERYNL
jgi:hypothetical protein